MLSLRKKICILLAAATLTLNGCSGISSNNEVTYKINDTKTYQITDIPVVNPYIGFTHDATNPNLVGDNSLVYMDVTFRELQPDNADTYNFETIDAENNVALWKEQGKHAVLRFLCDKPSGSRHLDIPDWLMRLTNDGTYYSTSSGSGYSPNYSNEIFIRHHKSALKALAEHYDDGFVSYVQMGSIGHNGEWYVDSNEGVLNLPLEDTRQRYMAHYVQSFSNAKLLSPYPFKHAKGYNTGLYNNTIGSNSKFEEWFYALENGGSYSQTEEEKALMAMPDFWQISPSCGEFTKTVDLQSICNANLDNTIAQIEKTHVSIIGPDTPFINNTDNQPYQAAIDKIRATVGYRFGITRVSVVQQEGFDHIEITLLWENAGIAPVYFELPVGLYIKKSDGTFEKISDVNINLNELLPDDTVSSKTIIQNSILTDNKAIYVGVSDSQDGSATVKLVSDQPADGNYLEIYRLN